MWSKLPLDNRQDSDHGLVVQETRGATSDISNDQVVTPPTTSSTPIAANVAKLTHDSRQDSDHCLVVQETQGETSDSSDDNAGTPSTPSSRPTAGNVVKTTSRLSTA
ncbi:unnamed protein product [Dibothriocephalus latus]|uniref:Uncharacterized protein n=1 Tax=Dibothriocephalus latus TaxID=60516 RepID=A0A3P7NXU8_DIBLA|nr:unnamed protein product [Dibothriocephalus latus]